MRRYADLLADALLRVREVMPWELHDRLAASPAPLVVDVREPEEFAGLRIAGSLNVPRGVLEQACEWDYDVTVPELAGDRGREIVLVCRSGNRSLLAGDVMQAMGFTNVVSLRTGRRGWNDADLPRGAGGGEPVDGDTAEALLSPPVRPDQRRPAGR
ncbi:MAG: rhodanese-like domain-containing protein [Rubrivivax sp.]|nr:rhodanese-like domain-containing protein [Rubrivivax sp.]